MTFFLFCANHIIISRNNWSSVLNLSPILAQQVK
jgi:hypothetical protein